MLAKSLLILAVLLPVLGCSDDPAAPGGSAGSAGVPSAVAGAAGGPAVGAGNGGMSAAGSGGTSVAAGGGGASEAGSSGADPDGSEEYISPHAEIAPEGLTVTAHPGGCGIMKLTALTLQRGAENGEVYAALKNEGSTPACAPALTFNAFDRDEQTIATGVSGVLLHRFYRLSDGSGTMAACVGPGDVGMVAITDLDPELVADVARIEFWCTFWSLAVDAVGELDVIDVEPVARDGGVAYTGSLVNGLDVPVSTPSVAVLPLSSGGRPIGVARASGTQQLLPGASWEFETGVVPDGGADSAAYPTRGP
jgi:hypothetical protein